MAHSSFDRPNQDLLKYEKLQSLIAKRQAFEDEHVYPPYSLHKTTMSFCDVDGHSLLHYAAAMGDIDKVKECIKHNIDINLKNNAGMSAIAIVLRNGHVDAAEYLYQQGASCISIDLSLCKDDQQRKWLTEKIQKAINESYPDTTDIFSPSVENHFFVKSIDFFGGLAVLKRAVEIGDMEFVKKCLSVRLKDIDDLLVVAAKSGQLDMVKFLIQNGAHINHTKRYETTALIAAINGRHSAIVDYLLTLNVDINRQDKYKHTALAYAIINKNEALVNTLLAQGADINKVNINGNTVLHLAGANEIGFLEQLLSVPGVKGLMDVKNIYGKTPLDLAIKNKNELAIRLLAPHIELETIKQHPHYGASETAIDQNSVMDKMLYFLKLNYRDTTYFNMSGHCNGFSFLKSLYAARGMKQYYFNTLALMSAWDGENESLESKFENIQQEKYYANLGKLFDQWINDAIWFQHATLVGIDTLQQEERAEQYLWIKDKDDYEYQILYNEDKISFNDNQQMIYYERTETQLTEIFHYLTRMPNRVNVELRGAAHATSGYKDDEGIFVYYDPNIRFETDSTADSHKNIQRIIDYKYILLEKFDSKADCIVTAFCFKKDVDLLNLDKFEIFNENEFPKNKNDALQFCKDSPNQFTHLHIAVMTRSLPSIERLLKEGHCDANAQDVLGRSALKMAIDSHFYGAVRLILKSPDIKPSDIDRLARNVYCDKKMDVVQELIDNPRAQQLSKLFIEAVKNKDVLLVEKLLKNNKVNVNQVEMGSLPLIEAINRNNLPIIGLLLQFGGDILIDNGSLGQESPLRTAMMPHSTCAAEIITQLKDVNEPDSSGRAAIHHAAYFFHADAIKHLLEKGADINLRSFSGRSVLNYIQDSMVLFDETNKNTCLKLCLPNFNFDLNKPDDIDLLNQLLLDSAGQDDQLLFNLVLDKCDKRMLNDELPRNNRKLLHHLMMYKHFDKIEPLLAKGAYVDAVFASGNTPLMGLIKIKDLPEKYRLIPLFLQYHADLTTLKNKDGKTVIDLVNESGDEEIKQLFRDRQLLPEQGRGLKI